MRWLGDASHGYSQSVEALFAAVVEAGLVEGEQVILYPGDQIEADVRVRGR